MPIEIDVPTHLNIRIDPKVRYLTEIAARARSMSLTDYVEDALRESFKRVSVNEYPELDDEPNVRELTAAERIERLKNRSLTISNPLSDIAESVWSANPFVRLQLIAVLLPHLMSEDEEKIWSHFHKRPDLLTKAGKFKHKVIEEQWPQFKTEALAQSKKGKSK